MHGRRERNWLRWLGLLVCTLLHLPPRTAAAEAPLGASDPGGARVLLLSSDAQLTARIRGQTRDLGVTLVPQEPPQGLERGQALELGRAHGADLVVWSEGSGGAELTLYLAELESGQLRSRSVSTPSNETLASSTTAEMGAIVVRSELVALLSERSARREAAAAQAAAAARAGAAQPVPPPARPPPDPAPPAEPPLPPLRPGPWLLAVAYRPSHPLPRDGWAHAVALVGRRDLGGFALGLHVSAAFPLSVTGRGVRLELQRTELRLEALKQWELGRRVRLGVGVAAGVVFDRRRTEQPGEEREPTAAAMIPGGGFGALAELQWLFARRVGALVAGGADGVPWRTRFVVDDGDTQPQIGRLFWLDPWLMVGLFTRFGG